MEGVRLRNGSETTTPSVFERNRTMSKIKSVKQFKEHVNGAFETIVRHNRSGSRLNKTTKHTKRGEAEVAKAGRPQP